MNLYFPIRWKLTFWYSGIVLFSLLVFAVSSYLWISDELFTNLDDSLIKISRTLTGIIKESSKETGQVADKDLLQKLERNIGKFELFKLEESLRFVGPKLPGIKKDDEKKQDVVWSAIFKHILLNPENYFIQIADTNNQIIWKSRNLSISSLPIDLNKEQVQKKADIGTHHFKFDNVLIQDTKLRLLIDRNKEAVITIAYTVEDVQRTLRDLFSFFLLSIPVILIISFSGGLLLTKITLRPIDKITGTANEITAKNLKLKLSVPPYNDEIGRLINTLNNMISRLDKSFTQIKQFTSDASHELRTPLTILRGELEIALNKDRSMEEYAGIIASALDEVMRMSKIIDSLLELSRADAGQTKMQLKKNNLTVLLKEILDDIEILAMEKNIIINTDIDNDVVFLFDEIRISQALLNILDNALKYNIPNGKIIVSLKDRNTYVELKVEDTGIGMSSEELSNIFDRFYRVDKARSNEIKGTGLGLSIVRWIIESHNGKIFVESQRNRGTNFIVMLPKDGSKLVINN